MTTDTSAEALERLAAATMDGYSEMVTIVGDMREALRAVAAEKRRAREGVTGEMVWKALRTLCSYSELPELYTDGFQEHWEKGMRAALESVWPDGRDAKDAARYRWLRTHFRFANDSMHELWFDAQLEPDDSGIPSDLDMEIDAAMKDTDHD